MADKNSNVIVDNLSTTSTLCCVSGTRKGGSASGAGGRALAEQRLRDAIGRGDVVPGQRLVEGELAALFGVTRSGVRLAIDTLIGEGLVERIPNQGARVRRVSIAEAVEVVECRMVLEGLIARKAAERITGEQIEQLRGQGPLMRQALTDGDLMKYSALIADLHGLIRDAARHGTAAGLVHRLQAQIVRHQFQLSLRPGRPQRSLVELEQLIQAILDREPDRAEEAARSHLASVIATLREADH
jgi:DNA-binding GntR family transcriptional regulator